LQALAFFMYFRAKLKNNSITMKKVIIPALAIAMLSLASCKKAYTCACTSTWSYTIGSTSYTDTYDDDAAVYSKKMSKKTAQAACDAEKASVEKTFQNAITENGQYPMDSGESLSTTCTLK
jgi:hypothetical protein